MIEAPERGVEARLKSHKAIDIAFRGKTPFLKASVCLDGSVALNATSHNEPTGKASSCSQTE
jgi:hypothetical protein